MKFNDAVFGAIFVLLAAVVLVHVQKFPMIPGQQVGPALFPGSIAAGIVVCGLLLIVSGLRHRASQPWFVAEEWTRSTRHVVAFLGGDPRGRRVHLPRRGPRLPDRRHADPVRALRAVRRRPRSRRSSRSSARS
jgi:hypothetical protein